MKKLFILLFSLLTVTAHADFELLGLTPATGPTSGGTEVTIHGRGFSGDCGLPITCLPPTVFFGVAEAAETRVINETTIVAVTPSYFPGVTSVYFNGKALFDAFTFTGEIPAGQYEALLLPVFVPPVRGAFGSEFHTSLRLMPKSFDLLVWGLDTPADCPVIGECINPTDPWRFLRNEELEPERVDYNGTPGRFLYVMKNRSANVAGHLRVHDVSRAALNYGTEMPIVRESELANRIVLIGVPGDPRFRNKLRIYSAKASSVVVTVPGRAPVTLPLRESAGPHDPRYAEFDDFPTGNFDSITVSIDATEPIWAFITVTNNVTQVISTITPQP